MPETMRRSNNAKSKIRSRVEHVFAEQKDRMGLFIRTIGIARATTKIGMANLVYNIKRFIFLRKNRRRMTGSCYARRPIRLITQLRSG
jgi:transposase, IS5 family